MKPPTPRRLVGAALAAALTAALAAALTAMTPLAPAAATGTFPVQVGTISNLGWVPRDYATSPDGAWVYGAGGRQIQWIRVSDGTVTRSQTYSGPFDMETVGVSSDGARLYLPLPDHSVRVVNTADGVEVLKSNGERPISFPLFCSPGKPVAAPTGGRVYVPCTGTGGIRVVDESSWTNTAINAVTGTQRIVISPDGARQYALSGGNVIVIDTVTGVTSATIASGTSSLVRLAITPDGSRVYAGSHLTNTVVAIDTATNAVTASAVLPMAPMELQAALNPIGIATASDRTTALSPVTQGRFFATAWLDVAIFDLSGTAPTSGSSNSSSDGSTEVEQAMPTAPQQAFVIPAGSTSADCSAQEPAEVAWPGLTGLEGVGWSVGFADWPNGGAGGWVCYRQPIFDGTRWRIA